AIAIGFRWFHRRAPSRTHVRLESEAPPPDSLGPGDARLYNADSTADVILKGDKIMVGLSPKTVARVRTEMDKSREKDTSGLGGAIASMVKKTVAENIGTHAVFPLADIRDLRYRNGELRVDWRN